MFNFGIFWVQWKNEQLEEREWKSESESRSQCESARNFTPWIKRYRSLWKQDNMKMSVSEDSGSTFMLGLQNSRCHNHKRFLSGSSKGVRIHAHHTHMIHLLPPIHSVATPFKIRVRICRLIWNDIFSFWQFLNDILFPPKIKQHVNPVEFDIHAL